TEFTFNTHKLQSTLYALLIHKNYNIPVYKGYICYVRSKNILKEIVYSNKDFENAKSTIIEIFDIILKGCFPKRTKYPNRCIDCSYRNICTQI
ncbi:MAG: Dna2/Cas4 domain-containing protein, partial [Ignavibacteria bacterium]|nr:Dna2/Cas4 domain-containing protein [Ignavibacteria bacterium]